MRESDTNDIIETAELLYRLEIVDTCAEGRALVHKRMVKINGEIASPITRKLKSGDTVIVGDYVHTYY